MRGGFGFEVTCYATPDDLRRLADQMDEIWKNSGCGDSLVADTWYLADGKVTIIIDQGRMKELAGSLRYAK